MFKIKLHKIRYIFYGYKINTKKFFLNYIFFSLKYSVLIFFYLTKQNIDKLCINGLVCLDIIIILLKRDIALIINTPIVTDSYLF